MTTLDFGEVLRGDRVLAILRGLGAERTLALARTALQVGIRCIEVPLQRPGDEAALRSLIAETTGTDAIIGAGTITSAQGADRAAALGARFTVSPGFSADVVNASHALGMPSLPGVATPTEVQRALDHGLTWVKAFPAVALGTAWFEAMSGPFPAARFVATGGVRPDSAGDFLRAGASAVAVGAALEHPDSLDRLARLTHPPQERP